MKNHKLGILTISAWLMACASSAPERENGPMVMNVRSNPDTITMDRNYNPMTTAEILAEVKDYTAPVQEVQLSVQNTPIKVPMQHVSGTTWRANLNSQQLKQLAIGNQTTKYEVDVSARDQKGLTKNETSIASIKVRGPDLKRF